MIEGIEWNEDMAIAALVEICRSDKASPADVKDAQRMILLIVGASDGFVNQHGERILTLSGFVKLHPRSVDTPRVKAIIEARRSRKAVR